jgi:hypothetical protein
VSERESRTTPSPEEQERIARELAEEFRRLRVEDLVIQTLVTVSSIGYRRLGLTAETREDRDLPQARLAIEAMRALTPVLENFVPAELVRDLNQSVANLQLAYAKATAEADTSTGQTPGQGQKGQEPQEAPAAAEADRVDTAPAEADSPTEADTSRGRTPGSGREERGEADRDR